MTIVLVTEVIDSCSRGVVTLKTGMAARKRTRKDRNQDSEWTSSSRSSSATEVLGTSLRRFWDKRSAFDEVGNVTVI